MPGKNGNGSDLISSQHSSLSSLEEGNLNLNQSHDTDPLLRSSFGEKADIAKEYEIKLPITRVSSFAYPSSSVSSSANGGGRRSLLGQRSNNSLPAIVRRTLCKAMILILVVVLFLEFVGCSLVSVIIQYNYPSTMPDQVSTAVPSTVATNASSSSSLFSNSAVPSKSDLSSLKMLNTKGSSSINVANVNAVADNNKNSRILKLKDEGSSSSSLFTVDLTHQVQLPWSYDLSEKCSYDASKIKMTTKEIQLYRNEWKSYIETIAASLPSSPHITAGKLKNPTRGIVYSASTKELRAAVISIKMLRHYNCTLPVEIWHYGTEELSLQEAKIVMDNLPNVQVRDMKLYLAELGDKNPSKGLLKYKKQERMWEMKGASLLHSAFDQPLLLDTDNVPARDPTYLWDHPAFTSTGAMFWKDFRKQGNENAIWPILEIDCNDEFEQESGQVLVDKTRIDTLRSLHLAVFMQSRREVYFNLVWGDKETFRLGWRALNTPYHMVRPHLGAIGGIQNGEFCGKAMAQFSPMWLPSTHGPAPTDYDSTRLEKHQLLFVHANLFKYKHTEVDGKYFGIIQSYGYPETQSPMTSVMDLGGSIGICTHMYTLTEPSGFVNQVVEKSMIEAGYGRFEVDYRVQEIEAFNLFPKRVVVYVDAEGNVISEEELPFSST